MEESPHLQKQDDKAYRNKKDLRRILIYTGIVFTLTYAYGFGLLPALSAQAETGGAKLIIFQIAFTAIMFIPAISVLLTRLLTHEGFKTHFLAPHLKGNVPTYLLAWFGPFLCIAFGAALWFLIRPDTFDQDMGYIAQQLSGQGVAIAPKTLFLIQTAEALLAGPLLNAVVCFGEEWGWRGYLVPKLSRRMKPVPMLLLSGLIWGLWHAPVIALGHNYGLAYSGAPWWGILMMCIMTTFTGIFLSYVTLKTKSCLPAIIGHGAMNAAAGFGAFFTADGGDPFLGPLPTGIVGMSGFLILAVILVLKWHTIQTREE